MNDDERYMKRCLELAQRGLGFVAPNPMVGAVIVYQNKVIGEGYHEAFGQAHAEVNAVNSVADKSVLSESTIYVSLEPCAHFGKTPPCADLLIKHNFKRVVIATKDSFSKVSGMGIERIKKAGIAVDLGILETEAREINRRFFTFHEKRRPYIILKWAQTKNGNIDILRYGNNTGITWITKPETKQLVHKWRSEESGILIGKNTAINDNPSLTVRAWTGKNPTRILLDSQLEVSPNNTIFDSSAPTIVFNTKRESFDSTNTSFIQLTKLKIPEILKSLHELAIQSVIIEGGKKVLESFIESNLWDEARILIGNTTIEQGVQAPLLFKKPQTEYCFGTDLVQIYRNS